MRLSQSISLNVPAAEVWPLLADPTQHPRWNPKVIRVDAPSRSLRLGDTFQQVARLGGRERPVSAEVVDLLPQQKLTLLYHHRQGHHERSVVVCYELRELGPDRCSLRQSVDLRNAGIPRPLRPVVFLVGRFGFATETSPLEHLAELIRRKDTIAGSGDLRP